MRRPSPLAAALGAERAVIGCGKVRSWFDELAAVRSGGTACDYVGMLADFIGECGISPVELVELTPNEALSVFKNWA